MGHTGGLPSLDRRNLLRGALTVGAVAGLSGALSSCTPSPSSNGKKVTTKPKPGGTFRFSVLDGDASSVFDGQQTLGDASIARLRAVFDTLVEPDEALALQTHLADEFTMESPSQYVIRLRQGVEFHNGKTMTADDLVYSIGRILDPAIWTAGAGQLSAIDPSRIQKLDKYTIRLRLKDADAYLQDGFSQFMNCVVPEGYSPKGLGQGPLAQIGTGPYKVKSFAPGRQTELVRNPNYFVEGQPYFDEVVITEFSDQNATFNSLLSGQADAVPRLPFALVRQVETAEGLELYKTRSNLKMHLGTHTGRSPFDDVRVRKAFALIADREALVEQAFAGHGAVANDLAAWSDPDYIGDELPQREHDLDQAKALLKAAGAENLALDLLTAPVIEGYVELAQVFAQQAKAAGVDLSVKTQDVTTYYGADWPSYTLGVDANGFTSVFRTIEAESISTAQFPMAHFSDATLDGLYADAKREADPARRSALVGDMQQIMYDEVPYIVPAFVDYLSAHSDKVQGFRPDPGAQPLNCFGHGFRTCYFVE